MSPEPKTMQLLMTPLLVPVPGVDWIVYVSSDPREQYEFSDNDPLSRKGKIPRYGNPPKAKAIQLITAAIQAPAGMTMAEAIKILNENYETDRFFKILHPVQP